MSSLENEIFLYYIVVIIIGISTYLMRAIFLFKHIKTLENPLLKKGLESVQSSLLVALVIPFTFFIEGIFRPLRLEVLAIIITFPIVWLSKKPGFSLIIALTILLILQVII